MLVDAIFAFFIFAWVEKNLPLIIVQYEQWHIHGLDLSTEVGLYSVF